MRILLIGAALGLVAVIAVSPALASTCTVPVSGPDVVFELTPPAIGGCLASGTGNINGAGNDGFLASIAGTGYTLLDKGDAHDATKEAVDGALLSPLGTGGESGSFSISSSLVGSYTSLVIALKAGDAWAAFLLPSGAFSGEWTINKDLSHANLYGVLAAVPLPAGLPLLAAGLGGLAFLGRRRKRVAA